MGNDYHDSSSHQVTAIDSGTGISLTVCDSTSSTSKHRHDRTIHQDFYDGDACFALHTREINNGMKIARVYEEKNNLTFDVDACGRFRYYGKLSY